MELWIRSQDKDILMEIKELRYNNKDKDHSILAYDSKGVYRILGIYKTKERALEVLDEIQNYMIKGSFAKIENKLGECINLKPNPIIIYQMPEK